MEQPGLEPASMWVASATGRGLALPCLSEEFIFGNITLNIHIICTVDGFFTSHVSVCKIEFCSARKSNNWKYLFTVKIFEYR